MRFMVIVPAGPESEAGSMPSKGMLDGMSAFNNQLDNSGALLAGEGLKSSRSGARITFTGKGTVKTTQGPLSSPTPTIAGFWIIDVESKDEAIRVMQNAPFPAG